MRITTQMSAKRGMYKALFELVENKDHWKKPIHAIIPKDMFQEFSRAVAYFHGAGLEITKELTDGLVEVTNNGYSCW